jgi:hypothetical protein
MNARRDRLERIAATVAVGQKGAKAAVDLAAEIMAEVDERTAAPDAVERLDELLAIVCGEGATHETHDIVQAVRDVLAERDAALSRERQRT